jgi:hypothetical protein
VKYLPRLASNCDLPISASQVARITDPSYFCQSTNYSFSVSFCVMHLFSWKHFAYNSFYNCLKFFPLLRNLWVFSTVHRINPISIRLALKVPHYLVSPSYSAVFLSLPNTRSSQSGQSSHVPRSLNTRDSALFSLTLPNPSPPLVLAYSKWSLLTPLISRVWRFLKTIFSIARELDTVLFILVSYFICICLFSS